MHVILEDEITLLCGTIVTTKITPGQNVVRVLVCVGIVLQAVEAQAG